MSDVIDCCEKMRSKLRGKLSQGDDDPVVFDMPSVEFAEKCNAEMRRQGYTTTRKYTSGYVGLKVGILCRFMLHKN